MIRAIPVFSDNYIWAIHGSHHRVAMVDPGDAEPVMAYLQTHQLSLSHILLTHHHADHIGGVNTLHARFKCDVFGPNDPRIGNITHVVSDHDVIARDGFEALRVIAIPGHTAHHIGYVGSNGLFCGDTLFALGCGRVFDGTMAELFHSLKTIAELAPETNVYCAHEYTASNARFAMVVDPENDALKAHCNFIFAKRQRGEATIPTVLADELAFNPFLRVNTLGILHTLSHRLQRAVTADSVDAELDAFTQLRLWKNEFRAEL